MLHFYSITALVSMSFFLRWMFELSVLQRATVSTEKQIFINNIGKN